MMSELHKIGGCSEAVEEGTNVEAADKTKDGKEAETGEKRQHPARSLEEKASYAPEEHGKDVKPVAETPEKKRKPASSKVQEEKPVRKGRQTKTSAKTKTQDTEATPAKKRGVGRPKKSSVSQETGSEMTESPVKVTEEVQTAKPVN